MTARTPSPTDAPERSRIARPLDPSALRALCRPVEGGACVSIYLPLEPLPPASQNAVRARSAAQDAVKRLEAIGVSGSALARWGTRLEDAAESLASVRDPRGSVVVLADASNLHVVRVSTRLPLRVSVGERLALRPLLRALALETPYRVLAVSAKRVALFEGDALGLHPASSEGLPASLEDALGSETSEKQLRMRGTQSGGGSPAFYSHDARSDERKLDFERFRHAVAVAANRRFAGDATPLVIAADAPHAAALRAEMDVPGLLDEALTLSPDAASPAELHARAWPLVSASLTARASGARASWERARNAGKGLDLLDDVAAAAVAGRVHRLWLAADAPRPGAVDPASGRILPGRGDDDVLDDLAALVIRHGGEVRVAPDDAVPTATGLAAELR